MRKCGVKCLAHVSSIRRALFTQKLKGKTLLQLLTEALATRLATYVEMTHQMRLKKKQIKFTDSVKEICVKVPTRYYFHNAT